MILVCRGGGSELPVMPAMKNWARWQGEQAELERERRARVHGPVSSSEHGLDGRAGLHGGEQHNAVDDQIRWRRRGVVAVTVTLCAAPW